MGNMYGWLFIEKNREHRVEEVKRQAFTDSLFLMYNSYGHMKSTIKVTYSLDATTVHTIDQLATSWGVPKSEVVRRSILSAAEKREVPEPDRLAALKQYQAASHLTREERAKWIDQVRDERKANL